MFAARVRKHIVDLGIAKRSKADRACLNFFKIGAFANTQARLNSRDPFTSRHQIKFKIKLSYLIVVLIFGFLL